MSEVFLPIFLTLVVFGSPGLYLYIIRSSRNRLRELELSHDSRIAELTRERDVLAAKVEQMEPNLEFYRQLAGESQPRKRVAIPGGGVDVNALVRAPIAIFKGDPDSETDEQGEVTAIARSPLQSSTDE